MAILEPILGLLPLDDLPRTGWIQRGVPAPESIAGHILSTAYVALALAPRVTPELDLGRVLAMALVHDAPEALTGDLPRVAADLLPEGAKARLEQGAAERLLAPLAPVAAEAFAEYQSQATREARFTRLCDKLQLGARHVAYVRAGQHGLGEFGAVARELDCGEFPPAEALRLEILAALDG
ncbi:MAG: HD domain-containing protein [Planctomycetota bacterium]|nr:MAG: HD domain-containing protein [Planctomycetota bacterium]